MNLCELLNTMTPYDMGSKEDFIRILDQNPNLKSSLISQLQTNIDWVAQAHHTVKFILNDYRREKRCGLDYVELLYVGPNNVPTVEMSIFRNSNPALDIIH